MLKDALQERTKLWSGLGDEDLDLLAVHEAYQYLSRTFVDDAAKNTVANQQGSNCWHFVSLFSWKHFHEKFHENDFFISSTILIQTFLTKCIFF